MLRAGEFTSNHLCPTSDFRAIDSDWHRILMVQVIDTLKARYAADPDTYVNGNLLLFYRPNDKRRHLTPDCMVVFGVPKMDRLNYLTWEEGKGPDVVIELTSKTTRREDISTKFELYRDVLRVKEYFLFDPFEDYLTPSMQGFRLRAGAYQPIRPKVGRFPSQQLGLHLERSGPAVRLWDPLTGSWLPTPDEVIATERQKAEAERQKAEAERQKAEAERQRADGLAAEVERLKKMLAAKKNGHTTNGAGS
jgi:Uma2 family endonuclease